MYRLIVCAVPAFVLLMAAEFVIGWRRQRNTYRLNDSISSLGQGLLSQALAVCTQLFQIGLYVAIAPHIALWHNDAFWNSTTGWVLAVLLFDFCDYWLHRAGHESAVFWAAHSVHHQSQQFNFSTALRQESMVAFLGWPFYLPMALVGIPADQYALAGLIVLVYQFWIHTEHIGKLGWFDRVFSSPSNHRVHHAVNDAYVDRNYGGMLVIWDRLFGTFAEEQAPCVYGTRSPLDSWRPLRAVFGPYAPLLHDAWHTRRWRDKLRVFFKAPGWRPADVAARSPQPPFVLDAVCTYDPPTTRGQRLAGTLQFIAWVGVVLAFLWQADTFGWGRDVALLALSAAGLQVTGALFEQGGSVARSTAVQAVLLGAATALLVM
ncbi:sterol desaturase family protein [Variovorax ginsengisoli]|uniref:Sterol desaturase/sphingolipid hydroxylase (Fatty acid hydroxylase superfamily) n=1 Tax=Variovorax ginsengisoli TaxID=363844 RepID=A0ABT9S8H1_9BURK|nr:sterol desaturase family protein [Variovorax ginsengisoli]MDP9899672.1 sterol desaturase/sphingolipid hydroxylase (fatty acid hydroxylase superfamily) [Variovorax ginsengisoli]